VSKPIDSVDKTQIVDFDSYIKKYKRQSNSYCDRGKTIGDPYKAACICDCEAIEMNDCGSIKLGNVCRTIFAGTVICIDSDDRFRSSRRPSACCDDTETAYIWYRVLCVGAEDISDKKIYLWKNAQQKIVDDPIDLAALD
jgi:hypothetical protein